MLEQQRCVREMLEGGSVGRMLEQQRRMREMLEGGSVGQVYEVQRRVGEILESIIGPSDVAVALAGSDVPRAHWGRLTSEAAPAISDDLRLEISDEIDAAATDLGEAVEGIWWVARLPWTRQVGLLVALLEAIAKATKFEGELTGTALPDAYFTAIDVLVAFAAALLIWIEAADAYTTDAETRDSEAEPEDR
jgi:hypothetical protein